MKILNDNSKYGEHVNFIDNNDVFVGYDLSQGCCELADWYIADEIIPYSSDDAEHETPDVSDYVFSPDFFQDVPSSNLDEGGMVVFKLIADGKPDLYLHLFNCHNGYYGHGFEVKHGGEIVNSDTLWAPILSIKG